MKHATLRRSLILAGACTLGFLIALMAAQPAMAQDGGPECPSGFVWQRMSGVGCVQENCFGVANAKLSYTGACICLDGYRGCYEPVDSSGVECGPFCPVSQLVGCVDPDALCPGEQPAGEQPAGEQPVGDQPVGEKPDDPSGPAGDQPENVTGPDTATTTDSDAPASNDPTQTVSVDNLVKDLEEFLAGKGVSGPTPGKAAAAGAALSTLIGTWVLVNAASGANIADLLRAVQRWRFGPSTSAPPGTPTPAGTKQASSPAIPLSTSGTIPGQKPGRSQPASGAAPGATPASTSAQKQPAQPGKGKPAGTPEVTPEKLETFRRRFQQIVSQKMNEGHYVRNTDFLRKAWNQVPGRFLDLFSGHKGGQCGEYSEWGKQWSEPLVRELFGDGAIVDSITIEEQTSLVQQDIFDEADALVQSNHTATRVILPNGESYILDYWSAIGDRQEKWFTDQAYQAIFGEPTPRDRIELIPEKQWINKWTQRIGPADAVVQDNTSGQQYLQNLYKHHDSEEAGIQAWRKSGQRTVPDNQADTVINYWKKKREWWVD